MTPTDLVTYFPNQQMGNLADDLVNVKTWDDFERRFLYGTGKSRETYKTYMVACKQFHAFTKGEHPMQSGTVANVEAFYDSILADGVSLSTAKLRMSSLKYMFGRVQDRFPIWQSPFDVMNEVTKRKLNASDTDVSEKGALTMKEYRDVLSMLRKDISLRGVQDYAHFRFLVVSGLRAFEAVGLQWKQIDECETGYKLTIRGKGGKIATITIEDRESVKALRRAFRLRFGRVPQGDDLVFQSTGMGRGGDTAGISKSGLSVRIAAVVDAARKAGIIRQNLAFSTHTTRHTCATLLVEAGVDIHSVQKHLRHANLNTTQVYLHTDQDKSEAWAKINGEVAA
jgi:integrase/recombinase XerD